MNVSPQYQPAGSASAELKAFCGLVVSIALGIAVFLVTDNLALGALLASVYAGWRSFCTAIWIFHSDRQRSRGWICAAFLLATAFWQGAAAAVVALLTLVLVANVNGQVPPMDTGMWILIRLLIGLTGSALIGVGASLAAVFCSLRVWVHPRLTSLLNPKMEIIDTSWGASYFNHAVFVLATSLGTLLMIPLFYLLTRNVLDVLFVAVMFPCLIFGAVAVYAWISRMVVASLAVECWAPASEVLDTVLSEEEL